MKEVLSLPKEAIDERFGVRGDEGVDVEVLGCTRGIPGGGFVYTNRDSLSIGVVVSLEHLSRAKVRPEELIADFKAHPAVAPWVEGAELKEYTAHLIPEGGYDHLPRLAVPGMLLTGDAAGLCLAAGIWLEGVNFAMGSGIAAGRQARAVIGGDLKAYRKDLESGFVLQDHKRLRKAPRTSSSSAQSHSTRRESGTRSSNCDQARTVASPSLARRWKLPKVMLPLDSAGSGPTAGSTPGGSKQAAAARRTIFSVNASSMAPGGAIHGSLRK